MEQIVLIGSGGHAKSIVDSIGKSNALQIAGFIDKKEDSTYRNYQVIGKDEDLLQIYEKVHKAFISIGFLGHSSLRNVIYDRGKSS